MEGGRAQNSSPEKQSEKSTLNIVRKRWRDPLHNKEKSESYWSEGERKTTTTKPMRHGDRKLLNLK